MGYNSRANDYKVVVICFLEIGLDEYFKALLYTLRTNSWKEIKMDERNEVIWPHIVGMTL